MIRTINRGMFLYVGVSATAFATSNHGPWWIWVLGGACLGLYSASEK